MFLVKHVRLLKQPNKQNIFKDLKTLTCLNYIKKKKLQT